MADQSDDRARAVMVFGDEIALQDAIHNHQRPRFFVSLGPMPRRTRVCACVGTWRTAQREVAPFRIITKAAHLQPDHAANAVPKRNVQSITCTNRIQAPAVIFLKEARHAGQIKRRSQFPRQRVAFVP